MKSILDNPLVLRYFGCDGLEHTPSNKAYTHWCQTHGSGCEPFISERILQAMQEPIRKGEKYLDLSNSWYREKNHLGQLPVMIADCDLEPLEEPHFSFLRLPDRFQRQEIDLLCQKCRRDCKCTSRGLDQPTPSDAIGERKEYRYTEQELRAKGWARGTDQPQRDKVEKVIRETMYHVAEHGTVALENKLRELVQLVREEA